MAVIHDEYGNLESDGRRYPRGDCRRVQVLTFGFELHATERDDSSWLLSGSMPIGKMADTIGIPSPPQRSYETVAGFVVAHLQHLPKTGEHIDSAGRRFEVVEIDGRRIDEVLASCIKLVRRIAAYSCLRRPVGSCVLRLSGRQLCLRRAPPCRRTSDDRVSGLFMDQCVARPTYRSLN